MSNHCINCAFLAGTEDTEGKIGYFCCNMDNERDFGMRVATMYSCPKFADHAENPPAIEEISEQEAEEILNEC